MADTVTVRVLEHAPSTICDIQRIFEASPSYFISVTGQVAPPTSADAMSSLLPAGKRADHKYLFGIFDNDEMVGCVDVIRAFPDSMTAFIGLFLVSEPLQRTGIGRAAYRLLEHALRSWQACARIQLAVVRANAGAFEFWTKMGFAPTGEPQPYRHGTVVSETIRLSKSW